MADSAVQLPDGYILAFRAEVAGEVQCADPCVPECTRHGGEGNTK